MEFNLLSYFLADYLAARSRISAKRYARSARIASKSLPSVLTSDDELAVVDAYNLVELYYEPINAAALLAFDSFRLAMRSFLLSSACLWIACAKAPPIMACLSSGSRCSVGMSRGLSLAPPPKLQRQSEIFVKLTLLQRFDHAWRAQHQLQHSFHPSPLSSCRGRQQS